MRIVIDASAAVELAVHFEKNSRLALALETAAEVLAPDLFVCEVVNAVWKYHQFQNLSVDTSQRAIDFALGMVETLVPNVELHHEAFLLARTTRRPAYDMFYLALARREDATLLTADSTLKKEAGRQGIKVL